MARMVLPINIAFKEWASQIRIDLPTVRMPIPDTDDSWRSWASQVVNTNNLSNIPIPTDQAYPETEDWKKWAAFFVNSVYT